MTSRANQRDTNADVELYECLNAKPPRSFMMIAGAGSGKTTSLIKGLTEILRSHGEQLNLRRQKVACITYTEIAAGEIWADVGNNPLVHVSTIHSFLWSLVRSFQSDIQQWVVGRIDERITQLRATAAGFGPRVQQRTRDKNQSDIDRAEAQLARIGQVKSFTYGTGSDYLKGVLGHDDVIKMVPQLISERPLMRSLLAYQYPILFVDESQDTMDNVVEAFKAVDHDFGDRFCLGFFGDPMQQIYATGIGAIPFATNWANITKPENFRCPTNVLNVANAIRRDGDGLVQTRGRTTGESGAEVSMPGSAHLFILPVDDRRDERLAQVRAWGAVNNDDPLWNRDAPDDAVKVLVIVHRMAAKRLGFGDLYAALNDNAPDSFKNGFLDGTAWPVRPFKSFLLPLADAIANEDDFEVMQVLRTHSPLLRKENLGGVNVAERLATLRTFTQELKIMMEPGSNATNRDVLQSIRDLHIIELDPRILSYLEMQDWAEAGENAGAQAEPEEDGEDLTKEISAMEAFLACPTSQLWGYYKYINDESPFSTQQGIKGAEFERVLVILDDDEGTHVQFSYEKYLGIKPLSTRDQANLREGKDTAVERTRRLFYVCCTRALKDLVVVLFTDEIETARRHVVERGIFPEEAIHLEAELNGY
ncbi:UvrD-helicase domain-containing protein [Burkholderia sp. BCC0322]|uniref:UvrD-helicase domain-containing protein n=1 Tax=unclassified Burkholderia TaxID=2613784 RepID=UPI00158DB358|nr:UvrD-helicase domain-containing protein [Burkholderia sp. BCC0322]